MYKPKTDLMDDSDTYIQKKDFFASLLTIYGRKPVTEALEDPSIKPYRLHLAETNRPSPPIKAMMDIAERKGAEICHHSRDALSRISKNRRQDQGVVLDIKAPNYQDAKNLDPSIHSRIIALENVTNPQNIGMTIRSVGASPSSGVLLAKQGNAPLDGLVIKSSAGTLFKTPIFYCDQLLEEVSSLSKRGFKIVGLTGQANQTLAEVVSDAPGIFILGNETSGLSQKMIDCCDELVKIPMSNNVESLNVSVAAALVAFQGAL